MTDPTRRDHAVGFFSDSLTQRAIADLASSDELVILGGAGLSMDHGLPGWSALVGAMLQQELLRLHADLPNAAALAQYVVDNFFQVPTAAIVDALMLQRHNRDRTAAVLDRNKSLKRELYQNQKSVRGNSLAGKLLIAAAEIACKPNKSVTIVTTNYDDLLERVAVESSVVSTFLRERDLRVVPYWGQRTADPVAGELQVIHVHGYLPHDWNETDDPALVFSEEDYVRWDERSAYRSDLIRKFASSTVLVLGSSLRDHNIDRALSLGYAQRHKKWALIPAYESARDLPTEVGADWSVVSDLLSVRGEELKTTILQPDFYGQVYQFLHELASAVRHDARYVTYHQRLTDWTTAWHTETNSSQARREPMSTRARVLADNLRALVPDAEHAKIELWVRAPTGTRALQLWCSSQALWLDGPSYWPRMVAIGPSDEYAAVRCFAERAPVTGLLKYGDRSRWTHYVATPVILVTDPVTQFPAGVVILMLNAPEHVGRDILPTIPSTLNEIADQLSSFGIRELSLSRLAS